MVPVKRKAETPPSISYENDTKRSKIVNNNEKSDKTSEKTPEITDSNDSQEKQNIKNEETEDYKEKVGENNNKEDSNNDDKSNANTIENNERLQDSDKDNNDNKIEINKKIEENDEDQNAHNKSSDMNIDNNEIKKDEEKNNIDEKVITSNENPSNGNTKEEEINDNDNNKENNSNDENKQNENGEEEGIDDLDADEKKRLHSYQFDGYTYTYKDRPSVIEEREGKIEFRVVNNDDTHDNMIVLTGLKNIFQKQLPEMPKAYIARLVYDRSHVSIAVVRKPLTVVGGITIRPFESHEFAEIVFCAISSTEQVRGYGAHLMNHLKDYVRNTTKIKYFLTYADNYAIGYFKKQGFTKEITLPKKVWMGYIKDYEGGTLMQCSMLPKIRYLDSPKILSLQKAAILRKIRSIGQSHIVHKGLSHFKEPNFKPLNPFNIPGVKEAGWTREMDDLAQKPKRGLHHIAMLTILTEMQNHPSNWPFLQPVNKTEVPDYYEVIKEPMDLSTMEVKLENDAYETMDDFVYDCKLIFDNCRQYNGENTTFYKNANKLEKSVIAKLKDFPEYSHCLDILTKK